MKIIGLQIAVRSRLLNYAVRSRAPYGDDTVRNHTVGATRVATRVGPEPLRSRGVSKPNRKQRTCNSEIPNCGSIAECVALAGDRGV